jgi:hypothetical protein
MGDPRGPPSDAEEWEDPQADDGEWGGAPSDDEEWEDAHSSADEAEEVAFYANGMWSCGGTACLAGVGPNPAAVSIVAAARGLWFSCAFGVGGRVARLVTWASNAPLPGEMPGELWEVGPTVPAPTGQCGIFDLGAFPVNAAPSSVSAASSHIPEAFGLCHAPAGAASGVAARWSPEPGEYPALLRRQSDGVVDAVCIDFHGPAV